MSIPLTVRSGMWIAGGKPAGVAAAAPYIEGAVAIIGVSSPVKREGNPMPSIGVCLLFRFRGLLDAVALDVSFLQSDTFGCLVKLVFRRRRRWQKVSRNVGSMTRPSSERRPGGPLR